MPRKTLSSFVIKKAFASLAREISITPHLRAKAPIEVVTVGGSIAVAFFENRPSTTSVDIILDPKEEIYHGDVLAMGAAVAPLHELKYDWLNTRCQAHVAKKSRGSVFEASKAQDAMIYDNKYLKIYMAYFPFCLETKLRQIENNPPREDYVGDAVRLLYHMKERNGGVPLEWVWVKNWNAVGRPRLVRSVTIGKVERDYEYTYRSRGIAGTYYDEEEKRFRYKNLDDEWVTLPVDFKPPTVNC